MKFCLWNCRSARNKTTVISEYIVDKSCCLDPLSSSLFTQGAVELVPFITKMVNTSGYVVSSLKGAAVTPLLTKLSLDREQLRNYRPVSNLSFISKLIERVVAQRLDTHLVHEELHEPFQSVYKKSHSMETALLRVQNDLLHAMECKQCALLVLLDLSAAFDAVQHDVLLRRLNT